MVRINKIFLITRVMTNKLRKTLVVLLNTFKV